MRKILLGIACIFALAPTVEGATTPFLEFPLHCWSAAQGKCNTTQYSKGAYTPATITSVLDHHLERPYDEDGIVTAFTGEEGRATAAKPKVNQGCYPQYSPNPGKPFIIRGLYIGTNDGCLANQGLNYDNHPGYDYKADVGVPVYAAASGRVVKVINKATGLPGRCVPKGIEKEGCGIWGYVGIDHGNGYITQYGHLSRIDVQSDDEIKAGDVIGLTGQSSPPKKDKYGNVTRLYSVPPHFHFEVLKENAGSPYGYAFVDPYGWEGAAKNDPLEKATGIPNDRLWKTGAQTNPAEPKVPVASSSTTVTPNKTEPPGRLVYETCFQMECFQQYLVTTRLNNDGLMTAKVATISYFNEAAYKKSEYKEEFARLKSTPVKYSNYKVSCKVPAGYIEYDNGARTPQPERNVSHATEGAFKMWSAVCEGINRSAISGKSQCRLNLKPQSPIASFGSFSNLRNTAELAYGYYIELYRSEDCLFGTIDFAAGHQADFPMGLIDDVAYEESTGVISFVARLSLGQLTTGRASRDLFKFTGVLERNSLRGKIIHEALDRPAGIGIPNPPENVVLKRTAGYYQTNRESYRTYSQWQNGMDPILKFRGPKW